HFAGTGCRGKTRQERLFLGQAHVLALASTVRLGLECLDATLVISHVRAGSPCLATRPYLPQSRAALSRFRAIAPFGCARVAPTVTSSAEPSSAAAPRLC